MDFDDTPEEAAFRAEAKLWLAENAPKHAPPADRSDAGGLDLMPLARRWQAAKCDARFARMSWPEKFGGRDASPMFDIIFEEEQRRYPMPPDPFRISLGMCIPTIMRWADAAAQERYVHPALRGDTLWCQLFSEPSAGSDLGNVRTRAVRNGDHWIVNGQKVWTTGAHLADYGTILVRTDPTVDKYAGLTSFYLDMRSPGVEVRQIRQMSGGAEFNEVFLTDVRVSDSQRLGGVGEGWAVSISTLMMERMSVNEAEFGNITIDDVITLACRRGADGTRPIDNPAFRAKLASIYSRVSGVRYSRYRMLSRLSGNVLPGPEASLGKVVLASAVQEMSKLGMEFQDLAGAIIDRDKDPLLGEIQEGWFFGAGARIAGGTDEILKNIIAERVLGLPQDIRVDRGVAFNQLPG